MSESDSDLVKIRRVALGYLARRDYSQHEITQKLRTKGYTAEAINSIVTQLAQAGLINEQRFIEHYIYWRRAKGYGPLRITRELQARGIAPSMIAEQVEMTDNAWFVEARNIWRKHFKNHLPTDFKLRAKQIRFLQYRGYTLKQIEYALECSLPLAEDEI